MRFVGGKFDGTNYDVPRHGDGTLPTIWAMPIKPEPCYAMLRDNLDPRPDNKSEIYYLTRVRIPQSTKPLAFYRVSSMDEEQALRHLGLE